MLAIEVSDSNTNEVIGIISDAQFRVYMDNKSSFTPDLIKRFNEMKISSNEPERVKQVLK